MSLTDPCPAPFNLAAHVLRAGAATPDKPALGILSDTDAQWWSYARLTATVKGIATLIAQHSAPGDRILMRLGNGPAFPAAYLGAIAAGRVPVPSSPQLTAPEATRAASALDPALILAGPGIALPDHPAPVLEEAALLEADALPPHEYDMGDPNRLAYIVQTSGTSGAPRFVCHAHRAIWARRMMHQGWEGLGPEDRLLHAGAFNWTFTLGTGLLDPWSVGATALIPAPGTAPEALPALLAAQGATIFAAAPGVIRKILRADLPPMPALRHGLCAGEKLAEPLRTAWRTATGTGLHEAFGQSECSTFISGSPARPAPADTLGFAQPGRRIAIVDDRGPTEGSGQIAIHRDDPGLMLGYLDAPEATAARFQGEWYLTGDWGHLSPEGAVIYEGRHDDLINAGGLRVSPVEIERALTDHPLIGEAAACPLRVGPATEIIGAFYTAETAIPDDDLRAHLDARLAAYKRPRVMERMDALPRNANNKLDRRSLRAQWEQDHGHA